MSLIPQYQEYVAMRTRKEAEYEAAQQEYCDEMAERNEEEQRY